MPPAADCKKFLPVKIILKLTVTKIKQERTNQDSTKIGPFFEFILLFSILLLQILNIASQLSCRLRFSLVYTLLITPVKSERGLENKTVSHE